jgi:hypothetical protein
MCGQVILRCLKLIRVQPDNFAMALIKTYKTIPIYFFAFTTFPAVYQFFAGIESIEYASLFLANLIAYDAPDGLIGPLFQSLLFGTFPFTDALWANLHKRLAAKPTIDDVGAISSLTGAIEQCCPLIPATLIALIREMMGRNIELCATVILRFLKITFELWYAHCPSGMSFGCGPSFLLFLHESENFGNGNSVTIANCFHQCRLSVPVYPFTCELCDMSSESMVFSHCDFQTFRQAFQGAEPRAALFKSIEVTDRLSRFAPYVLDYFPNVDRRKKPISDRLLFTGATPLDTLFEPSLFYAVGIEAGNLRTEIAEDQQKLADLDDVFRMRVHAQFAHSFQQSIRRYRNATFAAFCQNDLRRISIRPGQMGDVARKILKQPREDRSLVFALLPELLRVVTFQELPATFLPRFWALRKAYLATAWVSVIKTPGVQYVIELVPEATRRPLTSFGDVFLLFSHIFSSVRTIGGKHAYAEADFTNVVKFVSLNSEFGGILKVFLFLDKFVLHNEFFMTTLDDQLLQDWNWFSRMMLSTMVQDSGLSADVSKFVTTELRG